jgi:tRNA A-37 threonylcarbamoyl transferase component Bud32
MTFKEFVRGGKPVSDAAPRVSRLRTGFLSGVRVLKTVDPTRPQDSLRIETAIFRACSRNGLSTSRIIRHDANYKWMIREWIDGTCLNTLIQSEISPCERQTLIRKVALKLANIHRLLSLDEDVRALPLATYPITRLVQQLRSRFNSLPNPPFELSKIIGILEQGRVKKEKLFVTHGDFSSNNVVINRFGVYAIDWEEARWAPGEMDIAFASSQANGLCQSKDEASYFDKAYAEVSGKHLEDMRYYRLLDAALQLTSALSVGEDSNALSSQLRDAYVEFEN